MLHIRLANRFRLHTFDSMAGRRQSAPATWLIINSVCMPHLENLVMGNSCKCRTPSIGTPLPNFGARSSSVGNRRAEWQSQAGKTTQNNVRTFCGRLSGRKFREKFRYQFRGRMKEKGDLICRLETRRRRCWAPISWLNVSCSSQSNQTGEMQSARVHKFSSSLRRR